MFLAYRDVLRGTYDTRSSYKRFSGFYASSNATTHIKGSMILFKEWDARIRATAAHYKSRSGKTPFIPKKLTAKAPKPTKPKKNKPPAKRALKGNGYAFAQLSSAQKR